MEQHKRPTPRCLEGFPARLGAVTGPGYFRDAVERVPTRLVVALCALCCAGPLAADAAAPPVVASVTAAQRTGTKLVDIGYMLSDPDSTSVNIYILVSKDSGTTWTVPAHTFTGAYGQNVSVTATPTAKAVVWDAGADWDGRFTTNCRVRVLANDAGLVLIPAGSFSMGDASDGNSHGDAPVHTVAVSAFYMDSTLVTGGKWNLVNEAYAASHGYTNDNAGSYKALNHPVQSISWFDAVKWCNARSELEGATPVYYTDGTYATVYKTGTGVPFVKAGANGYRLPTEAEWEKAARGGLSGKRFPWGDTISHSQANYYASPGSPAYDVSATSGYHPTYNDGTYPYTSPVGSFAANGYGLYDMAGNVFEWCWDWYGDSYYTSGQTDPQGPGSTGDRVFRGGSWTIVANVARCANRGFSSTVDAFNFIGFRCVRGL